MKIAFTICSNNYLSQAKVLGDSLLKHNPDYTLILGLCDKRSDLVDYASYSHFEIIEADKIGIPNLEWMTYNYDIIELNTATKPFYFRHILKKYTNAEVVMYFDPDIKVFNKLSSIEAELENRSCVLTPHITKPIPIDGYLPTENIFLNYGIYNLGFFAIRRCKEADLILSWWENKLTTECYNRVADGLFVDQLPMSLAPIYFDNVSVSKNLGLNFAYWNMHERELGIVDDEYIVNSKYPLLFFHFSNFKPTFPLSITPMLTRYRLEEYPLIKELFENYAEDLIANKYDELRLIPCHFVVLKKQKEDRIAEDKRQEEIALDKENRRLIVRIKRKTKKIFHCLLK